MLVDTFEFYFTNLSAFGPSVIRLCFERHLLRRESPRFTHFGGSKHRREQQISTKQAKQDDDDETQQKEEEEENHTADRCNGIHYSCAIGELFAGRQS